MKWTRARVAGAFAAFLVLVGVIVSSARPNTGQKQDMNKLLLNQVRNQATPVSVAAVALGTITRELRLTGDMESPRTANVSPAVAGQVISVSVVEGSRVKTGQILAQLNPSQPDIQVSQSQQGVQAAQSSYSKAISARELTYRQAANDVAQARIGVGQAETGLSKANAGADPAAIQQAQAQAREAHAGAGEAADALRRTQFLFDHGVVPASTLEDVRTKSLQATASAEAADAGVRQAQQGPSPQDRQLAAEKVTEARQALQAALDSQISRDRMADSDVQAAATQVRQAQDQLRLTGLQSAATRIVSPIDGVVSQVRIHVGEAAMPGQPVFAITSLGNVHFETSVSDTEKLQLAAGQPAQVTLEAVPGRVFQGRVGNIVPVLNPGATGFDLVINIDAAGAIIPPGAYARAVVQTGKAENTIVIPSQAVVTDQNKHSVVYVIQDNVAHQRSITLGLTTPGQDQVVSGLQVGETIATVGAELLHDSAPVTVESPASAPD